MIVPGSASFPAIASLGRRLLPALSVVRCTVCVAPDSDHDPDRAFFFTLYFLSLLAFLPISLIAQCSFLSASIPSARLNATALARLRPLSIHICLVFLLICPFGFTHTPCLLVFGCTAPLPHYQHHQSSFPPFLPVLREIKVYPWPSACVGLGMWGGFMSTYAAGVPCACPSIPLLGSF